MKKKFITITGTRHYYGNEYFKKGMKVRLIKEKDNGFDKEAIKVEVNGLGTVGYVANSPYTVLGESYSAGRIYDHIGKDAEAKVKYILPQGVVCTLKKGKEKKSCTEQ